MPEQAIILYIEDNPDNQRLVQKVLSANGYSIAIAEDGTDGVTLARASQPTLILVDLGIPGLDGYETTTRLRGLPHLEAVPIIALTADSTAGSRERALVAGCDGYLVKPIDPRLLPRQIDEFIAGKREVVPADAEAELLRVYSRKLVERLEEQVRELSRANAELKEIDRMKSQFLATLSHELRTPLTSLVGYLELFDRGLLGELSQSQRDALSVMRRSGETLTQQLNNLLYFQELRMRKFVFASVLLQERLGPLLDTSRHRAAQRQIRFEVIFAPLAPLNADGSAIEMLLRNLIDNAIKFSPSGGRVLVSLRDEPEAVLIRVADTGPGIPPEAHEKIFLPFYQVDTTLARNYPGSGLGLAIVRHIAEAHGGSVHVRSQPQQGSVFTVTLPRGCTRVSSKTCHIASLLAPFSC
ncbi:hybrid sensor histidine kinase/response regulator [Candidatus Gracilibacteria bacterium]|nr:hybrid sensor histidine kinase/response regulator [Candidatus Gracilibacteria bacterium]